MAGLRDRTPQFLTLLDVDAPAAMEGFYKFAKPFFRVAAPSIYNRVAMDRREDVFHEVVRHCIDDDFRVLRQYRPLERATFAGWFTIVATRKITDMLRHDAGIAAREVSNPGYSTDTDPRGRAYDVGPNPGPDAVLETEEMREILYSVLRMLGDRCRLLIRLCVRGYKNRQITLILGEPPDQNKRIGTEVADCRKRLVRMLQLRGYELSDFLSAGV